MHHKRGSIAGLHSEDFYFCAFKRRLERKKERKGPTLISLCMKNPTQYCGKFDLCKLMLINRQNQKCQLYFLTRTYCRRLWYIFIATDIRITCVWQEIGFQNQSIPMICHTEVCLTFSRSSDSGRFHLVNIYQGCYRSHDI